MYNMSFDVKSSLNMFPKEHSHTCFKERITGEVTFIFTDCAVTFKVNYESDLDNNRWLSIAGNTRSGIDVVLVYNSSEVEDDLAFFEKGEQALIQEIIIQINKFYAANSYSHRARTTRLLSINVFKSFYQAVHPWSKPMDKKKKTPHELVSEVDVAVEFISFRRSHHDTVVEGAFNLKAPDYKKVVQIFHFKYHDFGTPQAHVFIFKRMGKGRHTVLDGYIRDLRKFTDSPFARAVYQLFTPGLDIIMSIPQGLPTDFEPFVVKINMHLLIALVLDYERRYGKGLPSRDLLTHCRTHEPPWGSKRI